MYIYISKRAKQERKREKPKGLLQLIPYTQRHVSASHASRISYDSYAKKKAI